MSASGLGDYPALRIADELARCHLTLARVSAEPIIAGGLTPPQAQVLFALQHSQGLSFQQIGEATLITKGTLTGIIQRLVGKQLVMLEPNPLDARSRLVRITNQGTEVISAVLRDYGKRVTRMLQGMGLGQRKALIQTLTLLHRRIQRNSEAAT